MDHADAIEGVLSDLPDKEKLFRKFIIPHRIKPELVRRLRTINVCAHTLFPGLDGLGRSVTELAQLIAANPSEFNL